MPANTVNQDRLMWLGAFTPRARLPNNPGTYDTYESPTQPPKPTQGDLNVSLRLITAASEMPGVSKIKVFHNGVLTNVGGFGADSFAIANDDIVTIYVYSKESELPAKAQYNLGFSASGVPASAPPPPNLYPAPIVPVITETIWGNEIVSTGNIPIPDAATIGIMSMEIDTIKEMLYQDTRENFVTVNVTANNSTITSTVFQLIVIMCKVVEQFRFTDYAPAGQTLDNGISWNSITRGAYTRQLTGGSTPVPGSEALLAAMPGFQTTGNSPTLWGELTASTTVVPSIPLSGSVFGTIEEFTPSLQFAFPDIGTVVATTSGVTHSAGPDQTKGVTVATSTARNALAFQIATQEILENTDQVLVQVMRAEAKRVSDFNLWNLSGSLVANSDVAPFLVTGVTPEWTFRTIHVNEFPYAYYNYRMQFVDPENPLPDVVGRSITLLVYANVTLPPGEYARLTGSGITTGDELGDFLTSNPDIAARISDTNYQVDLSGRIFTDILGADPNSFLITPKVTGTIQVDSQLSIADGVKLGLKVYGGLTGIQTLLTAASNLAVLSSPLGVLAVVMAGVKVYKAIEAGQAFANRDTTVYKIPQDMAAFLSAHPEYRPGPTIPGAATNRPPPRPIP